MRVLVLPVPAWFILARRQWVSRMHYWKHLRAHSTTLPPAPPRRSYEVKNYAIDRRFCKIKYNAQDTLAQNSTKGVPAVLSARTRGSAPSLGIRASVSMLACTAAALVAALAAVAAN